MPRKQKRGGHGGARQGTPGTAYSNRSDLTQAPRAVSGQTYGVRSQQIASQRAVPLPQAPSPAVGSAPPGPPPPGGGAPLPPPINAPTQNPGQPLTAGIPSGAGPGPEALGPGGLSPIDEVRAMFAANPNSDMRRLLAYIDGWQ